MTGRDTDAVTTPDITAGVDGRDAASQARMAQVFIPLTVVRGHPQMPADARSRHAAAVCPEFVDRCITDRFGSLVHRVGRRHLDAKVPPRRRLALKSSPMAFF